MSLQHKMRAVQISAPSHVRKGKSFVDNIGTYPMHWWDLRNAVSPQAIQAIQ